MKSDKRRKPFWIQHEFSHYRLSSWDILPQPFAWVSIPSGQVRLVSYDIKPSDEKFWQRASYIPKGRSQIFDVSSFEIARYPTTNAQFARFIEENGYEQSQYWTDEGWTAKEQHQWKQPLYWHDTQWNKPDYPVVGVSWYEALAFCHWLSDVTNEQITLPTEQQWQFAAQGEEMNRNVAWGISGWLDPDLATYTNWEGAQDLGGTTPVTQYEGKGDSFFGVVDMTGNVCEWSLTDYKTGRQDLDGVSSRVAKGGCWTLFVSYEVNIFVTDRWEEQALQRSEYVGFRCARRD